MAQKLSEAERRRLTTDFDPPVAPQSYSAPSLTGGKTVRVTASLQPMQYVMLQELARRRGQSLSRTIGDAVVALYEKSFNKYGREFLSKET